MRSNIMCFNMRKIILVICFNICLATIIKKPVNIITSLCNTAKFHCTTDGSKSVVWQYAKNNELIANTLLFFDNTTMRDAIERNIVGKIERSIASTNYKLIINSVTAAHQGRYECHDNEGSDRSEDASAFLFVTKSGLKCISYYINDTGFIGYECNLEYVWSDGIKKVYNDFYTKKTIFKNSCETRTYYIKNGIEWVNYTSKIQIADEFVNMIKFRVMLQYQYYSTAMSSPVLTWRFKTLDTAVQSLNYSSLCDKRIKDESVTQREEYIVIPLPYIEMFATIIIVLPILIMLLYIFMKKKSVKH